MRPTSFFWVAAMAVVFFVVTSQTLRLPLANSHTMSDGAAYRFQAKTLAIGRLVAPEPPDITAFRVPMTRVGSGAWFGQYYPGYPLILALGTLGGVEWVVNSFLAGLAVCGTFLLGRMIRDSRTGVLAALLVAASPLHARLASSFLSHSTCAVLILSAFLALLHGSREKNTRWAIVSGFLFGWAVATRPLTGLALAPALGWVILVTSGGDRRVVTRLAMSLAAGAVPWAIVILFWNRLLTGDPFMSVYDQNWPDNRLGFHPIKPRWRPTVDLYVEAYTPAIAFRAMVKQLAAVPRSFFSQSPVLSAILLAAPLFRARAIGGRGLLLLLFPVFLVVGYFFYPGVLGLSAHGGGPRYYSEAIPFLAVLVAIPWASPVRKWPRLQRLAIPALALLVVVQAVSHHGAGWKQRRLHPNNAVANPSRCLERFVSGLSPGRRLLLIDVSTFNWQSVTLTNRPDLVGDTISAIYCDPARNRRVMAAFPGHDAFLGRWDPEEETFRLEPYVAEDDAIGPPKRFPYTLPGWTYGPSGSRRGAPPGRVRGKKR